MAETYDSDGLDASWEDLSDLPDLTDFDVDGFLASDGESKSEPFDETVQRGGRFNKLVKALAGKGAKKAKALAAHIGRKKYGKQAFAKMAAAGKKGREMGPPRDPLFRASYDDNHDSLALRVESERAPELFGHFATFNQWTEINSVYEGNFMEQISPGAFQKTFKENRDNVRVLFQHGRDAQVGDKPLGPIEELEEDDYGARYVVPLLDTSYNRDLVPGLQAGLYGASFRMRVTREDFRRSGIEMSDYNPKGLPERKIREIGLSEFGPVTFPAYRGASAGVRSITDEILLSAYAREPDRFRELLRTVDPHALEALKPEPEGEPEKELPHNGMSDRQHRMRVRLEVPRRSEFQRQ